MHPKTALIIADGAPCSVDLLQKLQSNAQWVLALDGAILSLLPQNISFNAVSGDFDLPVVQQTLPLLDKSIEIIPTPSQELTDLDKGIEICISRGFTHINIVWATGKRVDHTLTNITNLVRYKHLANLTIIDDYSVIYPIQSPFSKQFSVGQTLSLIPVGITQGIVTKKLLYPLHSEALTLGYRAGTSNQVTGNGLVEISFTSGDLLVVEPTMLYSF